MTLLDGLVVIGGGLAHSHDLIMPALVAAVNGNYSKPGGSLRRVLPHAYYLEDMKDRAAFLGSKLTKIPVPGTAVEILHDPMPRFAIGLSRIGTSEAIALGAYNFALRAIDCN
jgi:glucokinase